MFEQYWGTSAGDSSLRSTLSSIGGPLHSSVLDAKATERLDSFSAQRLQDRFNNNSPDKNTDDPRGWVEVMAWITYFRATFWGEVTMGSSSGNGTATSSTTSSNTFSDGTVSSQVNVLHTMFGNGNVRWINASFFGDDYYEITDLDGNVFRWMNASEIDDWSSCGRNWAAGQRDSSVHSAFIEDDGDNVRITGRFWFDLRELGKDNSGTTNRYCSPRFYPNGDAMTEHLHQYFGNYLDPLAVRYNAGLLGLANRPVTVKTADSTQANGFYWGRKDNFGNPNSALFDVGSAGSNFFFVAKSQVTLTGPPVNSAGRAFLQWLRDGVAFSGNASRTITINDALNPIGRDGVTYTAQFEATPTTLLPPSLFSATAVSSSQINLTWSDVANETGFKIERRLGSSGSWSQIATRSANVTSYSDTGRIADTAYSYRVRAYNASGDSDPSNVRSATTQSAIGTSYTLTITSANPSTGIPVASFIGSSGYVAGQTPMNRSFANGTVVGVSCAIVSPSGQAFQKWQLDGVDYAFTGLATVTMNAAHTLTAVYGATAPPLRVLSSLAIEGPSSVDERNSAQYLARATYTDGSSAYITPEWDDNSSYADISSSGLLDASAVSSDRQIEIEATFSAGGITKVKTKDVTIRNTDAVPTYTLSRNTSTGGSIGYSPKANSYAAGTVVSLHANEDDGYVFSHWTGDASGTEDDITIRMDGNRSVTAHFAVDTSIGNIRVNISPPQAVAEGAQWKYHIYLNWRPSGDTQDGLSPRTDKNVYFKDIPGWITPDNIRASIVGGQTTVVNATYREILGSVQVTLSPDQASVAGARWGLDGGAWTESGVTLAEVSTGNHTVEFLTVPGWTTPPTQTVPVERGVTSTRSGDYGPPAGFPIITAVSPRTGPISGGTVVTIEGVNLQQGATVSFGGVAATSVTVVSPTRIVALTPPRTSYGSVSLSLTSGGQTVTQPNGFSYLVPLGSNIELVGQIGGNVEAVAVVGNMVYYGEGAGLVVSDFTNSAAPVERGRIALPAFVKDVVVVNNIAFVAAAAAGLYAVDVSTPTAPSIVGFFDTDGYAYGVTVSGGVAYVADFSALQILDVTNPAAIVRLGSFDTAGIAQRVSVGTINAKNYAFIAERDFGMRVLEVTTPSAVVEVANVPGRTVMGVTDVKLIGTKLYFSDWQGVVKIFDVSNPATLVQTGSRDNIGGGAFIDVVGNRLYTCDGGLRVADLAVTPNPTNLGYFDAGPFCDKLVVANGLAFAAMGRDGLKVVAVSNPASMSLRSVIQTLGGVEDVWVSAGVAFVGNSSGLHTVDVSNPARPVRLATLPGDRVTDIVVADGKATLVNYGDETVRIANVANPSSLSLHGTYTSVEAWNVALMGSTPVLAAATRDTAHLPKLDVLNISSPSSPQSAGSVLLDSANGIASAVTVVGSWAFVGRQGWAGTTASGLDVVNLANPASPQKVGSISIPNFLDVAASEDGNFVYVPAATGIQVVDVTVKATPVLGQVVDSPQTPGVSVGSLHVVGNRLLASDSGFIFVFDISDPASPQMVGYYDIPSSGNGFAMAGDLIFVAGGNGGVSILRLKDVDRPTVAITSPTPNSAYSTSTALLSLGGAASDDKGVVRVSWENNRGGGGVASGTTSWQIADIQLAAGVNIITVTAEDANGNLATDGLAVTASLPDTTPPAVMITAPKPDDAFVVETNVLTLSGSAADNQSVASVTWSNDFGGSGSAIFTGQNWSITNLLLVSGPNVFHVIATDAAGNSASDTGVVFLVPPDTNAPNITIEFPTLNAVYETDSVMLNLSGMAADNLGVTEVKWASNQGGEGVANGVAPWNVNDIPLQQGLNVIEVIAYDAAGNTAADTLSVMYTPPPLLLNILGMSTGGFSLELTGPPITCVIQVSSNLVHWLPLSTNTIPAGGTLVLFDSGGSNEPMRFYRAKLAP